METGYFLYVLKVRLLIFHMCVCYDSHHVIRLRPHGLVALRSPETSHTAHTRQTSRHVRSYIARVTGVLLLTQTGRPMYIIGLFIPPAVRELQLDELGTNMRQQPHRMNVEYVSDTGHHHVISLV